MVDFSWKKKHNAFLLPNSDTNGLLGRSCLDWPAEFQLGGSAANSSERKTWEMIEHIRLIIWMFPKIVVPPNHPF